MKAWLAKDKGKKIMLLGALLVLMVGVLVAGGLMKNANTNILSNILGIDDDKDPDIETGDEGEKDYSFQFQEYAAPGRLKDYDDMGVMITDCDSAKAFKTLGNGTFTSRKNEYVQGTGAMKLLNLRYKASGPWAHLQPVDISAYAKGSVHISLYVNDPELFGEKSVVLELTSGNIFDVDELAWYISPKALQSGWNELYLGIEHARVVGKPDLKNINFFRIYADGSKMGLKAIVDNVYATNTKGRDYSGPIEYPTTKKGYLLDFDTLKGLTSEGALALSNAEGMYKEGVAALSVKQPGSVWVAAKLNPTDITEYQKGGISFWLYINDTEYVKDGRFYVELTSSGTWDQNEISWRIAGASLHAGWNEVTLSMATASKAGGNIDFSKVNYIRIFGMECSRKLELVIDAIELKQTLPKKVTTWKNNELVIYENEVIRNTSLDDAELIADLSGKKVKDLSLYVKMTFTAEQYAAAIKNSKANAFRIKFSNHEDKINGGFEAGFVADLMQEITFNSATNTYVLEKTIRFKGMDFSVLDQFSWGKAIKRVRIYNGDGMNQSLMGVVIDSLKFVYTPKDTSRTWQNNELIIYEDEEIASTSLDDAELNVDVSGKEVDNLSLYIKMTFTEEQYKSAMKNAKANAFRIKFSNYVDKIDGGFEAGFAADLADAHYDSTTNTYVFGKTYVFEEMDFSVLDEFSWEKAIKRVRIYNGDGMNQKLTGVVINSLKFVYTPKETNSGWNNNELIIYKDKKIKSTSLDDAELNVDVSEKEVKNLSLYVQMTFTAEQYQAAMKSAKANAFRIKFSNYTDKIDGGFEAGFAGDLADAVYDSTTNTYVFSKTYDFEDRDFSVLNEFSWEKAIKRVRIYNGDGMNQKLTGVVINSLKFVYTPEETKEWTIYKNKLVETTSVDDATINLDLSKEEVKNLSLYIKMTFTAEQYEAAMKNAKANAFRIKFSNYVDKIDGGFEAGFAADLIDAKHDSATDTYVFEKTFVLKGIDFSVLDEFSWGKAIKRVRIYNGDGMNQKLSGVVIDSLKFVYTPQETKEWTVYENKLVETTSIDDATINLDLSKEEVKNLSLYVKMTFTAEQYQAAMKNAAVNAFRIKFSNYVDKIDGGFEAGFVADLIDANYDSATDTYVFEKTFVLRGIDFSVLDEFSWGNAIKRVRIYNGDGMNQKLSGVVIDSLKFVYTPVETKEWTVYKNKMFENTSLDDATINLDLSKEEVENLSLYVKMTFTAEQYAAAIKNAATNAFRIKFSNYVDKIDGGFEAGFAGDLTDAKHDSTTNTYVFEKTYIFKGIDFSVLNEFRWEKAIKRVRIYNGDGMNQKLTGVLIDSLKFVYTPD